MATKKEIEPELTQEPETADVVKQYYKITSREYLVTFPPYSLILYPGTSAVLTGEHYESLHHLHKQMLDVTEITAQEFTEIFAKQGKVGWV
jgi:hypothetical protein